MISEVVTVVFLLRFTLSLSQTIDKVDRGVDFTQVDCTGTCQKNSSVELSVRSLLDCASLCQTDGQCENFFYRQKNRSCTIREGRCCEGWRKYLLRGFGVGHKELYIKTPENQYIEPFLDVTRYGLSAKRGRVTFKMRTCDVDESLPHLGLSEFSPDVETPYFQIIFRPGTVQLRKRKGSELALVTKENLFNCQDFHPFWCKWSNTAIEVGQGYNFSEESMFMQWDRQTNFTVNFISVASWGISTEFVFFY